MPSTWIVQKVPLVEFQELLYRRQGHITINEHAYFRLSEMQRKVYKEGYLQKVFEKEKPVLVGIQRNGRYAAFYRRKEGYLRIVFKISPEEIEIITFYITDYLPNV